MTGGYDAKMMKEVGYRSDCAGGTPNENTGMACDDANRIFESGGFVVYLDKQSGMVCVQVSDYHAGSLVISEEGIEKMLKDLKNL